MSLKDAIAGRVRATFDQYRGQRGLTFARLPVPETMTLSDVPDLPECRSVEIERRAGVMYLVYWKDIG